MLISVKLSFARQKLFNHWYELWMMPLKQLFLFESHPQVFRGKTLFKACFGDGRIGYVKNLDLKKHCQQNVTFTK